MKFGRGCRHHPGDLWRPPASLHYSFASLSQYLNTVNHVVNPATGKPFNYTQLTQQFGNNVAQHRTTPFNFFAQDDFHFTPKFTALLRSALGVS